MTLLQLGDRPLHFFLFAQLVSTIGDNIVVAALPFILIDVIGSPRSAGLVLAVRLVAIIVVLIPAGAWADHKPRRGLVLFGNISRCLIQLCFALLLFTHAASLWLIFLLVAAHGAATGIYLPASMGMLPELIDNSSLQKANGYLTTANGIGLVLGPIIGGFLISFINPGAAICADALSFALAAAAFAAVPMGVVRRAIVPLNGTGKLLQGIRLATSQRWIGLGVLIYGIFNFTALGGLYTFGPILTATRGSSAAVWSGVLSGLGAGNVFGGILASRLKIGRQPLAAMGSLVLCIPILLALALKLPFAFLLIGGVTCGAGMSLSNTFWLTAIQKNTSNESVSSVIAVDFAGSYALRPLGLVAATLLAQYIGTIAGLLSFAAALAVCLCITLTRPTIRATKPDLRVSGS